MFSDYIAIKLEVNNKDKNPYIGKMSRCHQKNEEQPKCSFLFKLNMFKPGRRLYNVLLKIKNTNYFKKWLASLCTKEDK